MAPDFYTSPISSINSGSFPGRPTISTSNVISALPGIRGFPAEAGRPFGPKARLPCKQKLAHAQVRKEIGRK
jgi:hypothetical protein